MAERFTSILLLLFCVFALRGEVLSRELESSGSGCGDIEGIVLDSATGLPVVGVSVFLAGSKIGAQSDTEGGFRILSVPAGMWQLEISAVGYDRQRPDSVRVACDTVSYGTIWLTPRLLKTGGEAFRSERTQKPPCCCHIAGNVRDSATGEPIAECSIVVLPWTWQTAISGEDGSFLISPVYCDSARLVISRKGYLQQTVSIAPPVREVFPLLNVRLQKDSIRTAWRMRGK